jgi:hypothetical protein
MRKRPRLSDRDKETIMGRYQWRCPGVPKHGLSGLCGRKFFRFGDAVFDHIGQRSITKDDSLENYQPLCPSCNDIKTHGIGGEKRITTAGSDTNIRAKSRRLKPKWRAHVRAMRRKAGRR